MSSSVTSPAPGDQCSLCQVVTTSVASSRRSSHGRSVITRRLPPPAQRARDRRRHETARLHDRRQRIADVERALDGVRARSRAARGAAACPPARDARRCAAATTQRRPSCYGPGADGALRPAEHVEVGDARQVDAARPRQAVPLPEARVHLHQLEAPVARIEPELRLRDAVEPERLQQRQRLLDDVVAPARLAHAAGAEAARHLHELAPAEQPERGPGGVRVGADRPERRVVAGDRPPAAAARSRRRCARPRPAPPASRTRSPAARSAA